MARPFRGLFSGMNYWLVKSEPASYSWTQFVKDGGTAWTGVRNFMARNHLRAMKKGDVVFFYHSVTDKQVVGLARVVKEAYPDATAEEGDWSCVDLAPLKPLKLPVLLATIRGDKLLRDMPLVKFSRLSVTPLTKLHHDRLLTLAEG
jgi:predicted RNA-binding protein with PUA-like domain